MNINKLKNNFIISSQRGGVKKIRLLTFCTQRAWLLVVMSEVIPPSSSPFPAGVPSSASGGRQPSEEVDEARLPITEVGQICYERVIPSESHYYKVPEPPVCTGKQCINS